MGKSLGEGAKLQQSIGGVETLYTKTNSDGSTDTSAVDKMLQYANQAYKTTGLSANEYMENVTSFSASLLSACAGDTNKSAEIANKAMIDMADNANKMGTDMGSIQNAYQGFAKQNYTMLDNLKLGYGGTKEEMDRLLKDAQAITGTKYDINNLADVYTAIGVIQDKLNITGTTAREAEQTFSGSFAMMKASVTNLLGNLSIGDGEAVARSMGELVESASTFFFGNFIPMLQTIFSNLPTATADYMPPFNGIGVSSLMVDLVTAVSNASSVKVNVDPTAGATVAQIVNLQEQIDDVKSFVGYESSDVYGVEVDFVNKKFTRLAGTENLTSGADFDKLTPWGGRKRCNLTNEGVMVAYRGETGYSEAGATSATITKGTTEYPSGTKVQTMVEQPLFYTKVVPVKSSVSSSGRGKKYDKARFYISPTPKAGFKPVDGFLDDNGILQDKIYLSAFEGSIFDTSAGAYLKADEQVADFATDMLSSIAGAKPASGLTQNLTRANVRKLCTNRGKGWKSHNIFALTATQWLILVEYASMNAQSVIGQGVSTFTDDGSTNMAVVTGATSGLGNGSGIDPNAGVDGKCSVSYRGEENLWGNIWTWLDAINIYNDKASGVYNAFVKPYGECKDDTTADGYKALDFNIATGEGYISGFGYDEDHPDLFLCAEHNGASNLPVGDYYWNNNDGFRVARLGGRWDSGAICGAWYLNLYSASSARSRYIGGRLLYVPQTKISA